MLKTWAFFTLGGLFTSCYSNAVRRLPLLRSRPLHLIAIEFANGLDSITTVHHFHLDFHTSMILSLSLGPALHFSCIGTGCFIGFLAHMYEENTEARYRRILDRNPDAPEKLKLTLKNALKENGK